MDVLPNRFTQDRIRVRSKWPPLKDIPTPDIVIIDLSIVMRDFRDMTKEVTYCKVMLEDMLDQLLPYILEEDAAIAGLATYVSNVYDHQLVSSEKKMNENLQRGILITSQWEVERLDFQARQVALAIEMVGLEFIRMMRSIGLYHEGNAYYTFAKMQDPTSARLEKSDIYFMPY